MPGGGLWDDALTLSQDTGCNVPLDRVYGVMGLVPEHLKVPPDYEILMTEVLSRVLLRVASHGFRRRPQYMWIGIYDILKAWKDCVGTTTDPLSQSLTKVFETLHPRRAYDDGERTVALILSNINISVGRTHQEMPEAGQAHLGIDICYGNNSDSE